MLQAALPFLELIESSPSSYRCPAPPKLFRSYERCRKYLESLVQRGAAPGGSTPITMHLVDTYVPVMGKEALGAGSGILPSLRAVLVLEDLGPVEGGGLAKAEEPEPPSPIPAQETTAPSLPQPPAGAGPMSAAWSMLDVERKKIEFEEWRHQQVGKPALWPLHQDEKLDSGPADCHGLFCTGYLHL